MVYATDLPARVLKLSVGSSMPGSIEGLPGPCFTGVSGFCVTRCGQVQQVERRLLSYLEHALTRIVAGIPSHLIAEATLRQSTGLYLAPAELSHQLR